jgi:hypothetical protein
MAYHSDANRNIRLLKLYVPLCIVFTVFTPAFAAQPSFAGGFSYDHQRAPAMAKGNAFAGEANEPSAIYNNCQEGWREGEAVGL